MSLFSHSGSMAENFVTQSKVEYDSPQEHEEICRGISNVCNQSIHKNIYFYII